MVQEAIVHQDMDQVHYKDQHQNLGLGTYSVTVGAGGAARPAQAGLEAGADGNR